MAQDLLHLPVFSMLLAGIPSCSSPASPEPAGPAGETPREGRTAGGAPRRWKTFFRIPICCRAFEEDATNGGLYEYPGQIHSWSFCPWCGKSLEAP